MTGFFAFRNIKMQRGRAFLFFCLFLLTAVVSFLFIGELQIFADDRITKAYDSSAYLQENDARLVVRYPDNRELTGEDAGRIRSVKNVEEVDLYGCSNDVHYYLWETKSVEFLTDGRFMRSSSCLSEDSLAQGHLPEGRNEIVLYSEKENLLGQEMECYFTADNIWEPEESCHTKVKVVGLLKEKTDQVYFDYRLCQMLTAGLDVSYSLDYYWEKRYLKYQGNMKAYPVIGEGLQGRQIRISSNFDVSHLAYDGIPTDLKEAFAGNNGGRALLHVYETNREGKMKEVSSMLCSEDEPVYKEPSKNGDVMVKVAGIETEVQLEDFSDQGPDIIEMSEELFNQVYDKNTTQASVYITSYGKADAVMDELAGLGYDALNTYRVGSTEYITERVFERLEVICLSVFVLAALVISQTLLLQSLLKAKISDYAVLRFMGMRMGQLKKMTYLEMSVHCTAAVLVTFAVMWVLFLGRNPFLVHLMQYYTLPGIVSFALYNILLMLWSVFFFHRLLKSEFSV